MQVFINTGNSSLLETWHSSQGNLFAHGKRPEEGKRQWYLSALLPCTNNKSPYNKTATFTLHMYKSTVLTNCLWSSHHWYTALLPSPSATNDLTQLVYVGLMSLWEQQLLLVHSEEVIQHDRPKIWQNLNLRPWIWRIQVLPEAIKQEWGVNSWGMTQELQIHKRRNWNRDEEMVFSTFGSTVLRDVLDEHIILHWCWFSILSIFLWVNRKNLGHKYMILPYNLG